MPTPPRLATPPVIPRLAATAASVAWLLPFVFVRSCGGSDVMGGLELIDEIPGLVLPAVVLPGLWWALGGGSVAGDALRLPAVTLGFLLGAVVPCLAYATGGTLLVGGFLSVAAWLTLVLTGSERFVARWREVRGRAVHAWWAPVLTRAPHAVGVASLAVDDAETRLVALALWGFGWLPLSLALRVASRAWPAWGFAVVVGVAAAVGGYGWLLVRGSTSFAVVPAAIGAVLLVFDLAQAAARRRDREVETTEPPGRPGA